MTGAPGHRVVSGGRVTGTPGHLEPLRHQDTGTLLYQLPIPAPHYTMVHLHLPPVPPPHYALEWGGQRTFSLMLIWN